MDGNVFGLRIYPRDCGKLKTCAVIFIDDVLWNFSKGFGYCTVFSMYLIRNEDYRVDPLKQLTNINQFTCGH